MFTLDRLDTLLSRFSACTVGVVGDLFLDRYLDLDATLTEPSLETGLDAYQVVRVRALPGAAGTVINNLIALGVGRVCPLAFVGDDGEGYELRQALEQLHRVDVTWLRSTRERRTPTYTKPMLQKPGEPARELHRLDIKNRTPLPAHLEARLLEDVGQLWRQCQALVVLDQVSEVNCGVVTDRVRERLAELATADPGRFVLADSRERIALFRALALKPNEAECRRALGTPIDADPDVLALAHRAGRPVFCTRGERGILLLDPTTSPPRKVVVPAVKVSGPTDIVGAGDSCSAAIVSAVAAGANLEEAAYLGNLVASITIQQLGTTGTATPAQVRERWLEAARERT